MHLDLGRAITQFVKRTKFLSKNSRRKGFEINEICLIKLPLTQTGHTGRMCMPSNKTVCLLQRGHREETRDLQD